MSRSDKSKTRSRAGVKIKKMFVALYKNSERRSVREAIHAGKEPPTDQHKHRALWDAE